MNTKFVAILLMGIVATIGLTPSASAANIHVTAWAVSSSGIDLHWSDPDTTSVITDYIIHKSANNGVTWEIYDDGVNTGNTASILGLSPGQYYQIKVTAVINGAMSNHFGDAAATTRPLALTNVIGHINVTSKTLDMSWQYPVNAHHDGFAAIEYRTINGIPSVIEHSTTTQSISIDVSSYHDLDWVRLNMVAVKHGVFSEFTPFHILVCGLDPTPVPEPGKFIIKTC